MVAAMPFLAFLAPRQADTTGRQRQRRGESSASGVQQFAWQLHWVRAGARTADRTEGTEDIFCESIKFIQAESD